MGTFFGFFCTIDKAVHKKHVFFEGQTFNVFRVLQIFEHGYFFVFQVCGSQILCWVFVLVSMNFNTGITDHSTLCSVNSFQAGLKIEKYHNDKKNCAATGLFFQKKKLARCLATTPVSRRHIMEWKSGFFFRKLHLRLRKKVLRCVRTTERHKKCRLQKSSCKLCMNF